MVVEAVLDSPSRFKPLPPLPNFDPHPPYLILIYINYADIEQ
jgi:hypothetical protein